MPVGIFLFAGALSALRAESFYFAGALSALRAESAGALSALRAESFYFAGALSALRAESFYLLKRLTAKRRFAKRVATSAQFNSQRKARRKKIRNEFILLQPVFFRDLLPFLFSERMYSPRFCHVFVVLNILEAARHSFRVSVREVSTVRTIFFFGSCAPLVLRFGTGIYEKKYRLSASKKSHDFPNGLSTWRAGVNYSPEFAFSTEWSSFEISSSFFVLRLNVSE